MSIRALSLERRSLAIHWLLVVTLRLTVAVHGYAVAAQLFDAL